jgi:hypothetical protein
MNGSRTLALAAAVLACGGMSAGADKKPDAGPFAIVAGTVFRDPGFALPDANVILTLRDDPRGRKIQQTVTTPRGEFLFHVPARPTTYIVKAEMKGFFPDEKEAAVTGEDRIELTLTLAPKPK